MNLAGTSGSRHLPGGSRGFQPYLSESRGSRKTSRQSFWVIDSTSQCWPKSNVRDDAVYTLPGMLGATMHAYNASLSTFICDDAAPASECLPLLLSTLMLERVTCNDTSLLRIDLRMCLCAQVSRCEYPTMVKLGSLIVPEAQLNSGHTTVLSTVTLDVTDSQSLMKGFIMPQLTGLRVPHRERPTTSEIPRITTKAQSSKPWTKKPSNRPQQDRGP
eukprot:1297845-Amphidinium_carterae.1